MDEDLSEQQFLRWDHDDNYEKEHFKSAIEYWCGKIKIEGQDLRHNDPFWWIPIIEMAPSDLAGWVDGQDKHGCVKKHSAEILTSLWIEPKEGKESWWSNWSTEIMIKRSFLNSFFGDKCDSICTFSSSSFIHTSPF